ncbi:MAG: CBS domain-containing protein [Promethearchaeati archaeon SRVP18_Atabeyarchaeia-1]
MLVKELMTKEPVTIDKDQLVSFVIDLMRKNRVSRLLVIDGGNLVGMVTEKDIVARLASTRDGGLSSSGLRVSSIMTSDPRTISPEAGGIEAAKDMIAHGVSGLPVVNSGGKLVGIVTKTGLMRLCLSVNKIYVGQVMDRDPISISPNGRLVNATRLLLEKDLSLLPVVDDGKLAGIITYGLIALAMSEIREKTDGKHIDKQIRQITVGNAMRPAPPICRPDSKIKDGTKLMIDERLKGLPVLDYNERLSGILTKTNLAQLICKELRV